MRKKKKKHNNYLWKRKKKQRDYAHLTDDQLIKCGTQAEKRGAQRAANPLTQRQARLWTYGWNKQHGKCTGCEQCHNVGTLQMPSSHLVYIRVCHQYEKEPNDMTFEDLILEANAREAAAKAAAIKRESKKEKEKNEHSTTGA